MLRLTSFGSREVLLESSSAQRLRHSYAALFATAQTTQDRPVGTRLCGSGVAVAGGLRPGRRAVFLAGLDSARRDCFLPFRSADHDRARLVSRRTRAPENRHDRIDPVNYAAQPRGAKRLALAGPAPGR